MSSADPRPAPPPGAGPGEGRSLRTASIQLRVVAAVMVVLAVVLLALSVSVQSVFAAQSDRSLDALLTGRAQLARQLARSGVRPPQVVNRVAVDGVLASLELRDGTVLGTPVPTGSGVRTVTTRLAGPGRVDGAQLTLSVNSSLTSGARTTLRRILLVGGLVALLLSALLVALAVRLALRPLHAMATLAAGIAGGARGRRLAPTRTDTEIGRTAQAFDEMLDELEGAELRARRAEEGTRAFLADAAHELRTPLAGLQAAAETLLQHGGSLAAADRERLEVLLAGEAQRAGRLVADLLAAARADSGVVAVREPVDLGLLVEQEVARARLLSPAATLTAGGERPVVVGDATALRGVLRNLLDNARRAAGPDGTVAVTAAVEAGSAVVHVRDDGPGVPAADRERIFDRLVRLDASRSADGGGTGLGLAIARSAARAHGGDLVCCPVPPGTRGADFRLTLPLPTPPAPAAGPDRLSA